MTRLQEERKVACQKALEKSCHVRERQTQMYAKLKPITTSKTTSRKSKSQSHPNLQPFELLASERARHARNKAIAEETRASIDEFEASIGGSMAVRPRQDGGTGGAEGGGRDEEKLSPSAGMVSYIGMS